VNFIWILHHACGYPATFLFDVMTRDFWPREGQFVSENMISNNDRETGLVFLPKFDANGLLTSVVVNAHTKAVLMVAMMDQLAIDRTLETGNAHFHSRSRGKLWMKGETSGNILKVTRILVDCDQDALILECIPAGPTCHTGAVECFYRELSDGGLIAKTS
jgi:phosphoribosyl-AMP cyclohydrolase